MKSIFLALVPGLLVSVCWRYGQSNLIENLLPFAAEKHKPIVFDNGSIRSKPAVVPSSGPIVAPVALHAIRKCQKGNEIVYTDSPCDRGFRELPVTRGSVTALDAQNTSKAPIGPQQTLPRSTLRDVLDESGNLNLREKAIERAINR